MRALVRVPGFDIEVSFDDLSRSRSCKVGIIAI